jgi:hypothetical protein
MGKSRRGWYEREEVTKVTLDWVKTNCRVTDREMELLEAVQKRKLVKRDHLEIILPSYRYLDSRTRLINRAITKLFRNMCLDKAHEKQEIGKGNSPCIVALDRGGSILLDIPHKKRITHERINIRGDEYIFRHLPANYKHINGINQTEVETIVFAENKDIDIVKWELEYPIKLYHNGENISFIPDVLLELNIRKNPFVAFLEYDTGSENLRYKTNFPIINDKLRKYRKYKLSKLWEEYLPYFPTILFVTEDVNRIKYFKTKAREYGLDNYAIYYENFTKFLEHLEGRV